MDHKIVCWGDYAIPVPLWANWLAMDEIGEWWVYQNEPYILGKEWVLSVYEGSRKCVIDGCVTTPPDPGKWNKQIYWIGD